MPDKTPLDGDQTLAAIRHFRRLFAMTIRELGCDHWERLKHCYSSQDNKAFATGWVTQVQN